MHSWPPMGSLGDTGFGGNDFGRTDNGGKSTGSRGSCPNEATPGMGFGFGDPFESAASSEQTSACDGVGRTSSKAVCCGTSFPTIMTFGGDAIFEVAS